MHILTLSFWSSYLEVQDNGPNETQNNWRSTIHQIRWVDINKFNLEQFQEFMSQFLISRKLSFFKTYADAITLLSENVCIPFHFWTNESILMKSGTNKVTKGHLMSLVLISYISRKTFWMYELVRWA